MPSTLDSKFNLFKEGLCTPFHALKLILAHQKLLGLCLAPVFATVIFLTLVIYALLSGAWVFVHSAFLAGVAAYSGVLFFIVSALLLSAFSFFAVSILTFLNTLFASPLNDILAEKTETILGIKDVPHWSIGRFFRVFWLDFRKTLITLFVGVIFGLGMLVPVANTLFFFGLALLNCFTFITYPQSRREHGILESLQWIRNHFWLSLGFGITTLILFSIPLVDFFALPISVVGGTLLFYKVGKKDNEY